MFPRCWRLSRLSAFNLTRYTTYTAREIHISSCFLAESRPKPKAVNALPREFAKKLEQWPKLIDAEAMAVHETLNQLIEKNSWDDIHKRGLALCKLTHCSDFGDAFSGRTVQFGCSSATGTNVLRRMNKSFSTGTPVIVGRFSEGKFHELCEAVVTVFEGRSIEIKCNPKTKVTFHRQAEYCIIPNKNAGLSAVMQEFVKECKKNLHKMAGSKLVSMAFRGEVMPSIHNDRLVYTKTPLDDSQIRAVSAAVNRKRPMVCIQGPPGTGKTKVLVEVIEQLVRMKQRVLFCAPTHVAVDNAFSRMPRNIPALRIRGTFDEALGDGMTNHPKYQHMQRLFDTVDAPQTSKPTKLQALSDANTMRHRMTGELLSKSGVLFTTVTSYAVRSCMHFGWKPDVVIIDEAAQCTEPATWIPILSASRCILTGDQAQLPPLVFSDEARQAGLSVSLMERLAKEFSTCNVNMLLDTQYRMNEKIMQWSSEQFYEGKLKAADQVKDINMSTISRIPSDSPFCSPLLFLDTSEEREHPRVRREQQHNGSVQNQHEAAIVVDYVEKLIASGVNRNSIGVIAPYFAQTSHLADRLNMLGVTVNTVDAFQGNEKEVIVFSLTRDNRNENIGFLSDERRMNVAVTRAKRQFAMVGNRRMMDASPTLSTLFDTISSQGHVLNADEVFNMSSLQGNLSDTQRNNLIQTPRAQSKRKRYAVA